MTFKPIGLGDRVKDSVTGFTGIAVYIATWLHGCIRVGLQSEKLKDGKPGDIQHFDQSQLVVVKRGVQKPMILGITDQPPPKPQRSNGGPARETAGFQR